MAEPLEPRRERATVAGVLGRGVRTKQTVGTKTFIRFTIHVLQSIHDIGRRLGLGLGLGLGLELGLRRSSRDQPETRECRVASASERAGQRGLAGSGSERRCDSRYSEREAEP